MRIAILGTRGIPASYGGFETFAEELSRRLVARGHRVTVYGRARVLDEWFTQRWFGQVRSRLIPTIFHKYLETIIHSCLSFIDCGASDADVVLLCNAANSPFIPIANLRGIPVAVNVDGVERKRTKWNILGKAWYRIGEWASVRFADCIVADAEVIADYYRSAYNASSTVIAYGADRVEMPASDLHARFGLNPRNYLLYVSRLEPENNALGVIEAYVYSGITIPLVIVGDAPYAEQYKKSLYAAAAKVQSGARVVFTGFQFGKAYRELRDNCAVYVQATEVGGTHPALVEAMAHSNCIIANDVPEHREVLRDGGLYYSKNDFEQLAQIFQQIVEAPELIANFGQRAFELAQQHFSWEIIANKYEQLLTNLGRRD